MRYEHKSLAVDSQNLQRGVMKDTDAWEFRGVQECLDMMSEKGWEHYQSLEIVGNKQWRLNNHSGHGVLLFFRRPRKG